MIRHGAVMALAATLGGAATMCPAGEVLYNGIRLPAVWPPRRDKLTRQVTTPPYLQAPPEVIHVDVGRQLFVDDFLIEKTTATRSPHRPEYYKDNPVVTYESVLLGLFSIHQGPGNGECARRKIHKRNEVLLGFSRDGFHFARPDRRPFLGVTEKDGDWNWGNVQSAGGGCLVVGDKLYFYASGRCRTEKFWDGRGSTGLAVLRRDGFASMDGDDKGATLTTRPILFTGKHLFVNADAAQGQLQVEVLDKDGKPIAPFTRTACVAVTADSTIAPVRWKGAADLSALAGRPVRLRFHLTRARLFAFWISPDASGASRGYVAAGGPGFTGPTDTVGLSARAPKDVSPDTSLRGTGILPVRRRAVPALPQRPQTTGETPVGAWALAPMPRFPARSRAPAATPSTKPAGLPDISTAKPDLQTPPMVDAAPAAGKRVKLVAPEYKGTEVYHALYLPTDWKPGGKYPVLVEYAGNGPYRNKYGDVSTGRLEHSNLGYGLSGGKGFLWLCLPYVDSVHKRCATQWWGDVEATVEYAKKNVPRVCRQYGGDPSKVILIGFSRGAIGCNYLGLHDDQIAKLWRAMIPYSHYDGVNNWGYAGSDRASALERLKRLGDRPQLICQENSVEATRKYLAATGVEGNFTFMVTPFRNHNDHWAHTPTPQRRRARYWLELVLAARRK